MASDSLRREGAMVAMLVAPLVYAAGVWHALPDRVTIHWNAHGEPNGWGGKSAVLLGPAISIGVYLLLLFIGQIDPKRMRRPTPDPGFTRVRVVVSIVLFAVSMFVVYANVPGHPPVESRWLNGGILLVVAMLGNVMINLKPSWFVGIRTPWTLSNDDVWRRTHRLGGRLWFWIGIAGFPAALLLDYAWVMPVLYTLVGGSAAVAVLYSFAIFRKQGAAGTDLKPDA
jgi:uncharacterized membrane protein